MQDMGALQPGLPSPIAVPVQAAVVVIDLQDCFFNIPLDPKDRPRFAFSLPSENLRRPYQRFQWKVLPQGMKNSPTLCQKFVDMALMQVRQKYPSTCLIHYMDDLLLAHQDRSYLQQVLQETVKALTLYGLQVAPEKIQTNPPINYLGRVIHTDLVTPQNIQLRTDSLKTLNDFQKLLGNINWIRPFLKLTTAELQPLFEMLRGKSDPTSERTLTPEGTLALQKVEEALTQHQLHQIDYSMPWNLLVLPTPVTPTGCLWQLGPLEWLHLPAIPKKIIVSYPALCAQLIAKGRRRSIELFGKEPVNIVIPYTKNQCDYLFQTDDEWQVSFAGYSGTVSFHLPKHPILQFIKRHPFIFPTRCQKGPIAGATLVFTDGSSNGRAALVIGDSCKTQQTNETSAQRAELIAVITAFRELSNKEFNLYSDSQYIICLFPQIETTTIPVYKTTISALLCQLQKLIRERSHPFYVGHVRAHSGLPRPIHRGNELADQATKIVVCSAIEEATQAHQLHHQNATALRYQFQISREAARQIVRNCTACPATMPSLPMGVNPRGLRSNCLWQMDVNHVPQFGKLSFVHVCVDTFSHVIMATARTGEAFKDVIQHLFICFAYMGQPLELKTDNAPAYTSKAFRDFCKTFQIKHCTGIPFNPQGQAIVERAHQTLKQQLVKLQGGELKYSSPQHLLSHALFVINFLNLDFHGESPMMRHWNDNKQKILPQVKWKDLLTGQWKGPDILLTSGGGYACIFLQDASSPLWIPDRLIRHVQQAVPDPSSVEKNGQQRPDRD
uniref:Uncharacterized protein n=1 Tax=Equus asinus asinus TaxID=83772 RepID=A0A8C4M0W2_EQUAS